MTHEERAGEIVDAAMMRANGVAEAMPNDGDRWNFLTCDIEAALTAAEDAEREACAKVADENEAGYRKQAEHHQTHDAPQTASLFTCKALTSNVVAAGIRARGTT